jgi:hypothetical protein
VPVVAPIPASVGEAEWTAHTEQKGEIGHVDSHIGPDAVRRDRGGLTAATPGGAASTTVNQTNHLTFSGPVGLPGVTLPRGAYTFQVIPLHPDIVRVLSRDGSRLYFTASRRASRGRPGCPPTGS